MHRSCCIMGLRKGINQVPIQFEAVDNALRFSCDLIERNERFTISAHFDEKGDMITTWQIHSLMAGTCRNYFALQV